MCSFKVSKLGVLVASDDPDVVIGLYREALSLFETSVEHQGGLVQKFRRTASRKK